MIGIHIMWHLIPLLLKFEALFVQNHVLEQSNAYIGYYQSYFYVFPGACIFSTAWDVFIPVGSCFLLQLFTCRLQQRGLEGVVFFPVDLVDQYEKVPVSNNL